MVGHLKRSIRVPLAVKLSPFFSVPANMAIRFDETHANAIVLFDRFYQPDFDIESLDVVPSRVLSRPKELLPRLHWTALLYGNVQADLAVTGGVHAASDVIKCILAAAKAAVHDFAIVAQRRASTLKNYFRPSANTSSATWNAWFAAGTPQ